MKFSLYKFCINYCVYCTVSYTPREELGTAKLFVGVTGNGVTVNIKGAATCNNNKQLLQGSSLVIKLIQILP